MTIKEILEEQENLLKEIADLEDEAQYDNVPESVEARNARIAEINEQLSTIEDRIQNRVAEVNEELITLEEEAQYDNVPESVEARNARIAELNEELRLTTNGLEKEEKNNLEQDKEPEVIEIQESEEIEMPEPAKEKQETPTNNKKRASSGKGGNMIKQLKNNVKDFNTYISDFTANLAIIDEQIKAAGNKYADYDPSVASVSLEEFYNSSLVSAHEFDGLEFDQLNEDKLNHLKELFDHEVKMNPAKINEIAKNRLEKQKAEMIEELQQKIADAIHQNEMLQAEIERRESKINSKINDIEYELNKAINERNNPKTEYERAVELNRLIASLNKDLEKEKKNLKFIDIARNNSKEFGKTLTEIDLKVKSNNFDFKNEKDILDKLEILNDKMESKVKDPQDIKDNINDKANDDDKDKDNNDTKNNDVDQSQNNDNDQKKNEENDQKKNEENDRVKELEARNAELEAKLAAMQEQIDSLLNANLNQPAQTNSVSDEERKDFLAKQEYLYVKGKRASQIYKKYAKAGLIAAAGIGLGFFGGPVVAANALTLIGMGTALPTVGRQVVNNIHRYRQKRKLKNIAKLCGKYNNTPDFSKHFDVRVYTDVEKEDIRFQIRNEEDEYVDLTENDVINIKEVIGVDIQKELDEAFDNEEHIKRGDQPVTWNRLYVPFSIDGGVLGPIQSTVRNIASIKGIESIFTTNDPEEEVEEANIDEALDLLDEQDLNQQNDQQIDQQNDQQIDQQNDQQVDQQIDQQNDQQVDQQNDQQADQQTDPQQIIDDSVLDFGQVAQQQIAEDTVNPEDLLRSAYQKTLENMERGDIVNVLETEEFNVVNNFLTNITNAMNQNPEFVPDEETMKFVQVFNSDLYEELESRLGHTR